MAAKLFRLLKSRRQAPAKAGRDREGEVNHGFCQLQFPDVLPQGKD